MNDDMNERLLAIIGSLIIFLIFTQLNVAINKLRIENLQKDREKIVQNINKEIKHNNDINEIQLQLFQYLLKGEKGKE